MNDPTYAKELIEANPVWELAFTMSEIMNDTAPIGWGKFIFAAECLLCIYAIKRKGDWEMSEESPFKKLLVMSDKIAREELGEYYIISESRMNNYLQCLDTGAREISSLRATLAKKDELLNKKSATINELRSWNDMNKAETDKAEEELTKLQKNYTSMTIAEDKEDD